MLDILRKNKKSLINVMLAGFIVILMIGFGVDTYNSDSQSKNAVIRIDGTEISDMQFARKQNQLEAEMRMKLGPNFDNFRSFLNIGQRAVDAAVMETLIFRLVDQLGFSASPRLIRDRIESLPFFQMNGLTESSYEMYRRSQGLTAEAFETMTRKEVAASQLEKVLVDLSLPSKMELKGAYRAAHTSVGLSYVAFDPKQYEAKVQADEAKLEQYYQSNSERFRSKKSVKYSWLSLDPAEYAAKVELSENDVRDLYEEKSAELIEPRKAKLRQVVLLKDAGKKAEAKGGALEEAMLGQKEDEKEAQSAEPQDEAQKKKAGSVLDRLNAGEDFAVIAKDISEDTTTKENGGDLGWITFDSLDETSRTAVEALKPGQTSDVIETPLAFKVIRLEEIQEERQKPFDEVKESLEQEQRRLVAPEYARAATEALYEKWRTSPEDRELSLEEFAKKNNLKARTTSQPLTVDMTADAGESLPPHLTEKTVSFSKGDRELLSIDDADYLVEVLEVRDSSVPPFAEVKEQVTKEFVAAESKLLAKAAAEELLNAIRPGDANTPRKTLAAAAQERGLTVTQSALSSRAKPASDPIFSIPEAQRVAFSLTPSRPVPKSVIDGGASFYAVELRERTAPSEEEVASKFGEVQSAEEERLQGRLITFMLAALKATADIWVDPALLDRFDGDVDQA